MTDNIGNGLPPVLEKLDFKNRACLLYHKQVARGPVLRLPP